MKDSNLFLINIFSIIQYKLHTYPGISTHPVYLQVEFCLLPGTPVWRWFWRAEWTTWGYGVWNRVMLYRGWPWEGSTNTRRPLCGVWPSSGIWSSRHIRANLHENQCIKIFEKDSTHLIFFVLFCVIVFWVSLKQFKWSDWLCVNDTL